ncbi:MAG: DUF3006 domain-containing protein [Bradymonadales bacterium]|nr:DUF3006 domain-containing protein [Bradymonadales bacterium]
MWHRSCWTAREGIGGGADGYDVERIGYPATPGRPVRRLWPALVILGLLLAGCLPVAPFVTGWIDRFEEDWAVIVVGDEETGYHQLSVPALLLPGRPSEGDWIVAGVWLPGSSRWQLERLVGLRSGGGVWRGRAGGRLGPIGSPSAGEPAGTAVPLNR